MTLRIIPIDVLITGIAYALLSISIYLIAAKNRSKSATVSSALFAYCSFTMIAKFVLYLTLFSQSHHAFRSMTDTYWFFLVLNGLRPYALLLGALFALHSVKFRLSSRVVP